MLIAVLLTVIGFAIIGKALYIMTAKKQYWTEVADRLKRDSVEVKPNRGNILSSDGQLMATSIPEYKIYMDFQAAAFEKDSLWLDKLDSVCEGLSKIFPRQTAAEFKATPLGHMAKTYRLQYVCRGQRTAFLEHAQIQKWFP